MGGDAAGPRPVAASDRREQFAVLGGDRVRPLGGGERGAGGHGDLIPEPVEDLHRDGIACQLGDAQMEPPVKVGRLFQVAVCGDQLELPGLGFEIGQRRGRQPPGALTVRRQLGGQRVKRSPDGMGVPQVRRRHRGDDDAPAGGLNQAVALQPSQRFAHRGAAHGERGAQRDLGEPIARPVHPGDDLLAQLAIHGFGVHLYHPSSVCNVCIAYRDVNWRLSPRR